MTQRGRDFSLFWLAQAISRFGDPITLIVDVLPAPLAQESEGFGRPDAW